MKSSKPHQYSVQVDPDIILQYPFYFLKVEGQDGKSLFWPEQGPGNPVQVTISDDFTPPVAVIDRIETGSVGQPLPITATVRDSSGIYSVRLLYRHVTQFEDYQSVEMQYDENMNRYRAEIPADFVINQWDVMYLIECIDAVGNGRLYPDLESEMPYVIVHLDRD
jgi:hypothetical protein